MFKSERKNTILLFICLTKKSELMKKVLSFLAVVALALGANATPYKALYAEVSAAPSGGGVVYVSPKNDEDAGFVAEQSADWGETAFIKWVGGENSDGQSYPGCTGGIGLYEVVVKAQPEAGFEVVCVANKVKANGIYTKEDCYAVIHGEESANFSFDFDYSAIVTDGVKISVNNASHPQDGHSSDDGALRREDVFANFGTYVNAEPDAQVFVIFRKIGESLPKFAGDGPAGDTFPIKLTTADGLPEQTSAAASSFTKWVSPTYTFDEPVSSFRLTVTHTSWQDAYNTSTNGGRGYIFFTMGEFYLYDAADNQVQLTAENCSGNATESPATNDGVIGNLCDGDEGTHYHTLYNATEEPRPVAQEYYLEITLPEPMTSFSFGFAKRSNSANIPSEIIVTKGGVDADPYAEYGFQLGDKVETIEAGGLYVFADEGKISSDDWGENAGKTYYLATGKDPRFASPAGTDKYYRIRRTPNVDCIFEAIPAGDGEFYLRSYLGGTYIYGANPGDGSIFIEQAEGLATAAKFHLDEEGYLVCNNHYYALNSQETLVAYDSARRTLSIFKASINNAFMVKDLEKLIADAEKALADNKEAFSAGDDGETAALEAAIAQAKTVTEANTADEISEAKNDLQDAAVAFMKLQMFIWLDWIQETLMEDNFGLGYGQYPFAVKNSMLEVQDKITADVDNRVFISLDDITLYLNDWKTIMADWNQIETFDVFPITIVAPEGQKQLGVLTDYSGYPNVEDNNNKNKYVYSSPTFVLEEAIDKFFVTFVHTNDGDHGGGYECTAIANFALFDANGKEVELTAEDFMTNAQETSEGPMEGICDKNDDGTPDVSTYWHSLWSSQDKSTGEHYICVTLPQPLSAFSFQYITRGPGIAPKEIVVGTEPYHYEPDATVNIRQQITSASELDPNKYYIFYGNIEKVSAGKMGTGFYAGLTSTYGETPFKEGVFRVIPTDKADTYKINFVVDGIYLERPTAWASSTSTINIDDAGEFTFTESSNLADAFKVWAGPNESDAPDLKYMLQDWSGSMGYYTISGEGFENDDTDGESDWYIYEVDPVAYKVYLTQVRKAAQLNTDDKFAMYGNLGKVNPDAGTPGGYYRNINSVGDAANNFTLFKLEEGANGTYKIHFTDDDVYLKAPTDWAAMATTDNAAEAGEFVFLESENLAGAFKIYRELDGKLYMLQDWGSYMGSYPIESLANDDTDGESDWFIFTPGDPSEEEIFREDYLGEYIWQWNDNWDPTTIREFTFNLLADPDSEDGVIIDCFDADANFSEGPLKGTFDGLDHTISFPTGQNIYDGHERWYGMVMIPGDDSYEKNIVFHIDLLNETITFSGRVGVQYVAREAGDENGGWWMLSSSWVKLIKQSWGHVERAVAGDAEVVSTSFFTVGGQAIAAPVKGVNIVRTVLSDGTVKTAKVLVK